MLCENPATSTKQLVSKIAQSRANVCTVAIVQIAAKAQMPNYTTMVQNFLSTLQLPMAIYMLDYYLQCSTPMMGTMRQVPPCRVRAPSLKNGNLSSSLICSKVRMKVSGGKDAFAFRHPSLEQTEVRQLLDSEAHHHKVSPIGTGRLIAMVGVTHTYDQARRECFRSCSVSS